MKVLYFSMIMAGILFMVQSTFAQAGPAPDRNFIHTEGEAEVTGQNDSARVVIAVLTQNRDLDKATEENAGKSDAVLDGVKGLKIEGMKLKTTNFRVSPQRDYQSRDHKIVGYEVENAIEVILEKFEPARLSSHVSNIVGSAMENGANNVSNIQFYIKEKAALEKEALTQATKEAIGRAQALAEAAGLKLKRIASLSTQPASQPPMPMMVRGAALKAEGVPGAPPVEIGESQIRVQVFLTYEIE